MLKKKNILLSIFLFFTLLTLGAKEILPPKIQAPTTFAIVIDTHTFRVCQAEVLAYKDVLEREGLGTWILAESWNNPQEVKDELLSLYKNHSLEGAVFIGTIPVPMIRDAQHLTSAFKMDQEAFHKSQSSVPSDRFYDDFNLTFDYLGDDPQHPGFHYFSLRLDSPQIINCSIYSGRIKPTQKGAEGDAQIANYLNKVIEARTEVNPLDVLCSYTGEGSHSNSLTAWRDERIPLREQLPYAFGSANSAKFFRFDMEPYMKETIANQLRRPELDLMIFHEHGLPERQYLTGVPIATDDEEYIAGAKREIRHKLRLEDRRNGETQPLWERLSLQYNIDTTWKSGTFDPVVVKSDSIEVANRGIELDDIAWIAPNPRMVIFDACYNGDFREDSYIAAEYIFASGKTLVGFGNSVNVLQDKSAGDLLGLLGLGFRVGQWARQVNILESHITGDPTFRFHPPLGGAFPSIDINHPQPDYWKAFLQPNHPPDVQALALHRLFVLQTPGLSELLCNIYEQSPYYVVRLQCMHLLPYYNNPNYDIVLQKAIDDPYEFIRRKAVFDMGKRGKEEFIPLVAKLFVEDALDERVAFNAAFSVILLGAEEACMALNQQLPFVPTDALHPNNELTFTYRFLDEMVKKIADSSLSVENKLFNISILRNNPFTRHLDQLLPLLQDSAESLVVRTALAEALGWYVKSYRKGDIIATCTQILSTLPGALSMEMPERRFAQELTRTINRLNEYQL